MILQVPLCALALRSCTLLSGFFDPQAELQGLLSSAHSQRQIGSALLFSIEEIEQTIDEALLAILFKLVHQSVIGGPLYFRANLDGMARRR